MQMVTSNGLEKDKSNLTNIVGPTGSPTPTKAINVRAKPEDTRMKHPIIIKWEVMSTHMISGCSGMTSEPEHSIRPIQTLTHDGVGEMREC